MLKVSFGKKLVIGLTLYLPSRVKIFIYKLTGAKMGRNVRIGLGSFIFAENIILKDDVVIGNDVHIFCKEIIANEEAAIDDDARIGGYSTCTLGKGCFIGPGASINVVKPVVLEDDVGMGGHIYTHGVWPSYMDGYPRKFEGVTIKRGAWVPPNTTILPGVIIGEETMIGTGAVVTRSMPSRVFAVGVPATIIRSVDEIQVKLDKNQKDTRFKEIIGDFKEWIKDTVVVENNNTIDDTEFVLIARVKRLFKVRRWGIYYTSGNINQSLVEKLFSLKGEFTSIIIVSQGVVDEEVLKRMIETTELGDFLAWIALENRSCKGNKDHFFLLFRRFLRSHYGVRLETSRKNQDLNK